jgi:thiamine kinase-like enzyme
VHSHIERLPVVFCHRDFWVTNIFYTDAGIRLIDWDTTGWGYLGEDMVSLIADEADVDHMIEYYQKCIPAYLKGFSEYVDISHIENPYIHERMILHYGYRLVEWYLNAESPDEKAYHLATLQKIHEIAHVLY